MALQIMLLDPEAIFKGESRIVRNRMQFLWVGGLVTSCAEAGGDGRYGCLASIDYILPQV